MKLNLWIWYNVYAEIDAIFHPLKLFPKLENLSTKNVKKSLTFESTFNLFYIVSLLGLPDDFR